MPTHYRTRVVDEEVRRSLDEIGAILLEGPRACGKTATGQFHAKSSVRLDVDSDARALASIDPALILATSALQSSVTPKSMATRSCANFAGTASVARCTWSRMRVPGHRDHLDRSIVITPIGHRDHPDRPS